jgi:hypothetical protein
MWFGDDRALPQPAELAGVNIELGDRTSAMSDGESIRELNEDGGRGFPSFLQIKYICWGRSRLNSGCS